MLRTTSNHVPANAAIADDSAIPFGVLVSPLAPLPPIPTPPPSDHPPSPTDIESYIAASAIHSTQLPRCYYCSAYISSQCTLNPRSWTCCLCNSRNSLPSRYTPCVRAGPQALHHLPELSRQIYDVQVPDDVPLTPVAYIFLLDINGDAAYLDVARSAIRKALDVVDGDTLAALAFYGDNISFVDARATGILRRFSPLDLDVAAPDVFPPDQWLRPTCTPLVKTLTTVLSALNPVPDPTQHGHALGPAIRAVLDMVEIASLTATRLIVLSAGEPNIGDGSLQNNDGPSPPSDAFPRASSTFYADLGARANVLGAMIDVYVASRTPIDIATLSPLAQVSGGRLVLYDTAESTMAQDVWQHLNDPAVVRGLLRIRTPPEFSVAEMYGSGLYRDVEVADVFRLSCHGHSSALAVEFGYGDVRGFVRRRGADKACIQVAFRGIFIEPGLMPQRVLRVETRTLGVTTNVDDVRNTTDDNAVATVLFHKGVATADEQGIAKARLLLFDWLAQLVAKAGSEGKGTEVDCTLRKYEAMRKLPRLIFGLIRSFMFRQEVVAADMRAAMRCIWEDLSADLLAAAVYPRLTSFVNVNERGEDRIALSWGAVRDCGHPIFLVDAFSEVVVYYAGQGVQRGDLPFPPPEGSAVMRERAACVRDRPLTPRIVVCREGTPKDRWFKSYLIEDGDGGDGTQSFSAFMEGVTDAAVEMVK